MATVRVYLDTRRSKKDNTFPIKIYITHNLTFRMNTKFTATPELWTGNEYSSKANNYKAKNVALRSYINKVDNIILKLEEENKLHSMSDKGLKKYIEDKLSQTGKSDKTFINYLDDFISIKSNPGTKGVYEQTKVKLLAFDSSCTFDTIDLNWLRKFEKWLTEAGIRTNARGIHFRNIRAVFNYAIDEEITTLYPFRKFRIKKEETKKRSLTVQELRLLKDYPCEEHQVKYRDLFMLMFYLIGINSVDLFNLKEIKKNRIEYYRAKTGKLYSIEVLPEAMEIINKYRGKNYLLDVLDSYKNYKDFTHRMNINLKQIGEMERKGLGGKKIRTALFSDITIYHARHTWASIASSLDISKETISAALGHEIGSRVTSIYIDYDMKKVDIANKKVIDHLFNRIRRKRRLVRNIK